MKNYLIAAILVTLIMPPLGAMIYGLLMGNPFIVVYHAVFAVAYVTMGVPSALFGGAGSLLHRNVSRKGERPTFLAAAVYGLIMGTICGVIPLFLAFNAGHWAVNRSIISFITTGAITGIICALLCHRFLNNDNVANQPMQPTGDTRAGDLEEGKP